jgi:hypothetical protein
MISQASSSAIGSDPRRNSDSYERAIEGMLMPQSLRKLTLSDAMILIAVTAAAFATARACALHAIPGSSPVFTVRMTTIFVALSLTISLIPLRLRQPRPRRLGRQPGTVACCAVALALVFILAEQASSWLRPVPGPAMAEPHYRTINLVFNLLRLDLYSPAVAGAWLALALSGRWRPERDWLDRAGRGLGVRWIVAPHIVSWLA